MESYWLTLSSSLDASALWRSDSQIPFLKASVHRFCFNRLLSYEVDVACRPMAAVMQTKVVQTLMYKIMGIFYIFTFLST